MDNFLKNRLKNYTATLGTEQKALANLQHDMADPKTLNEKHWLVQDIKDKIAVIEAAKAVEREGSRKGSLQPSPDPLGEVLDHYEKEKAFATDNKTITQDKKRAILLELNNKISAARDLTAEQTNARVSAQNSDLDVEMPNPFDDLE